LLKPPKALPEAEGRLAEGAGRFAEAPGDALGRLAPWEVDGRLADGVPVDGRAPTLPGEAAGRAAAPGWVKGRAPPELQPRASEVRAEAAAPEDPLVRSRLWSGCHFFCVVDGRAPACVVRAVLPARSVFLLTFRFTFLSTSTSTSTSP
jgi:hypothetical protein